eukprot:SAG25_NODE_1240_length_3521_cov_61.836061_2_plen_94_part_00
MLYIEEDNFVAPDILSVMEQMVDVAESRCGEKCGVLDLGLKEREATNDNGAGWAHKAGSTTVAGWESSKHNMGMAFNRKFWEKMAKYVRPRRE